MYKFLSFSLPFVLSTLVTLTACGDGKLTEVPKEFHGTWYSKEACADCAIAIEKRCDIQIDAHSLTYVSDLQAGDGWLFTARKMERKTAAIDDERRAEPVPGGFRIPDEWETMTLVGDILKQGDHEFVRVRPACDTAAYQAAKAKHEEETAKAEADEAKRTRAPACAAYVDCICGFDDNPAMEKACGESEKLLDRAAESACASALAMWKRSISQASGMYKAAGIDIPSACQ